MTLIYAHLAPDFMASEVGRMSFAMPIAGVASLDDERRARAAGGDPVDTACPTGSLTA